MRFPPGRREGGRGWPGALRHRNYRLFWFGQLVSLVGTWMQTIAQAWLVLQLTHDPLWLGVVAAAQFLPVLVLGLFGGVIADVLPKRNTLVATQAIQMVLAFLLAWLSLAGVIQVWEILVLAALLGLVSAIDMPTRQSFVAEMVGRDDLASAVGLNSAAFNAARITGPALGGLLIGVLGVTAPFLINGFSFIAVIIGLLLIRSDELVRGSQLARPTSVADVRENLGEGLRYVRRTPVVLLSVVLVGTVATFGMNFQVTVPALADEVLGVGATGLGLLLTASGIGSLLAALIVSSRPRPRIRVIILGAAVLGILEVVIGLTRTFPISLVALFGAGAGAIAMAVSANTSIQLAVPDELRGRVMSVYTTVFAGSTPIGGPIIGWIASTYGTPAAFVLGGAACVVAAGVAAVWVSRSATTPLAVALAPVAAPVPVPAGVAVSPEGPPRGSAGS